MARKPITVQNRTFDVSDDHYAVWWDRVNDGIWEPATMAAFEELATPGSLVVDIGAWIGATALYAAAGGCDVVTFEPDPVAYPILQKNLALNADMNARIDARNVAVGTQAGEMQLYNNAPGNSGSSLVRYFGYTKEGRQNAFATVEVIDGLAFLESLEMDRVSLVKIDIEGAEYDLIPHIAPVLERFKPALHLSLHPLHIPGADEEDFIKNRREKSLRVAEALSFYTRVRHETEEGDRLIALDEPFIDRADRRPFPRSGWVFQAD